MKRVFRPRMCVVAMAMVSCGLFGLGVAPASAATSSSLPHDAVGGFPTDIGELSLVYADGSVRDGYVASDAFPLRMNAAVVGGAPGQVRGGYWAAGADGGVFSFSTSFYGSMGGRHLNQPVSSIASTRSRRGYWLVARDGGVFSFGDAKFYGSAAVLPLRQPIVGIQTTATGNGYRLVARDGGVFDYGDATFYGSLPGRGTDVSDVVGLAMTRTGRGYWIARSNGEVYAFGDAPALGHFTPSLSCDRISAIVGNPVDEGYALIAASGALGGAGSVPVGEPFGTRRKCGHVTARIELAHRATIHGEYAIISGATKTAYLVIDNQTGTPLRLLANGQCTPKMALTIANSAHPNLPGFTAECGLRRPLVIPVGQSQRSFAVVAFEWFGLKPLPPGDYEVRFVFDGQGFPPVAPHPVRVLPRE